MENEIHAAFRRTDEITIYLSISHILEMSASFMFLSYLRFWLTELALAQKLTVDCLEIVFLLVN